MKIPSVPSDADRRAILERVVAELTKAKADAKTTGLDMLGYLIAVALDEAETELRKEGSPPPALPRLNS